MFLGVQILRVNFIRRTPAKYIMGENLITAFIFPQHRQLNAIKTRSSEKTRRWEFNLVIIIYLKIILKNHLKK